MPINWPETDIVFFADVLYLYLEILWDFTSVVPRLKHACNRNINKNKRNDELLSHVYSPLVVVYVIVNAIQNELVL